MLGHVVSCWGVSKHIGLCLWGLPLLYSVLQPDLVPPTSPFLPVPLFIVPFQAILGLEEKCRPLPGSLQPPPKVLPSPSPCSISHVSHHHTQGYVFLQRPESLAG